MERYALTESRRKVNIWRGGNPTVDVFIKNVGAFDFEVSTLDDATGTETVVATLTPNQSHTIVTGSLTETYNVFTKLRSLSSYGCVEVRGITTVISGGPSAPASPGATLAAQNAQLAVLTDQLAKQIEEIAKIEEIRALKAGDKAISASGPLTDDNGVKFYKLASFNLDSNLFTFEHFTYDDQPYTPSGTIKPHGAVFETNLAYRFFADGPFTLNAGEWCELKIRQYDTGGTTVAVSGSSVPPAFPEYSSETFGSPTTIQKNTISVTPGGNCWIHVITPVL
jgi:hypothetical protein